MCDGNEIAQRWRSIPSQSWTPMMPNMKKTKKQSNKTLPSIGNVSSKSITNIRMPGDDNFDKCQIESVKKNYQRKKRFLY